MALKETRNIKLAQVVKFGQNLTTIVTDGSDSRASDYGTRLMIERFPRLNPVTAYQVWDFHFISFKNFCMIQKIQEFRFILYHFVKVFFVSFHIILLKFSFISYLLNKKYYFTYKSFQKNITFFCKKKAKNKVVFAKTLCILESFLSDRNLFYQIEIFSIR